MIEWGLVISHTTPYRWVQQYAPEIDKRTRPYLKCSTNSYRVDETYVKIKRTWYYLYRAVDTAGDTLEFLLTNLSIQVKSEIIPCTITATKLWKLNEIK